MRIAIPVDTDKETIVQRTGQAPFFAIYEDEKLVEFVQNGSSEGGRHHGSTHDEHGRKDDEEHTHGHKKDIEGLSGCDVILVQMMGEHMREALESLNIKIIKIRKKDGEKAEEALGNFLNQSLK